MSQQTGGTKFADPREEQSADTYRILHSAVFRRAPRLREMLHYILECTASGRTDDLTEIRIAENVFGRRDYNPSEENLVRVSARQLRSKIAEYYETEGRDDELQVHVPKGGYCATFRRREEGGLPAMAIVAAPTEAKQRHTINWMALTFAVIAIGSLAVSLNLWNQNHRLRAAETPAPRPTLFDALLSNPGQRTNIVVTDSAVVMLDKLLHRYISVDDYASDRYLHVAPDVLARESQGDFLNLLRTRQISSFADMRIIASLFQAYPQRLRSFSLHHSRNMHARDFSNGDNFVLIGSSRSNPWVVLFEDLVNFHTSDRYGKSCYDNRRPLPGEQKLYCSENQVDEQGIDYSRIVLRHNTNRTGRVLLIAGIDMEATEAAGEFFLNPQSVPAVLQHFHVNKIEDLPDYELLLKSYSIGGTGRSPEIVSARKL